MGYLFPYGATRKDIIDDRCASWKWPKASYQTITKCCRGNVLWRVVEIYMKDTGHFERYIACDLLASNNGDWGYKDMTEEDHPYYYSCPVSYLEGTRVFSTEWREGVKEDAARRKARIQKRNALKKRRGW